MPDLPRAPRENFAGAGLSHALRARRAWSFAILAVGSLGFSLMLLVGLRASALAPARITPAREAELISPSAEGQSGDFSRFSHTSSRHSQLPCLLCHRRATNSPKLTFPVHLPCTGCHEQQFNNPRSGICTVCHVNPEGGGEAKPFPRLQSFNMRFDHARHMVGAARPAAGCAACHKPAVRGMAFSIPAGLSAHVTCFQCHAPNARGPSGNDISSCDVCHQIGRYVRVSEYAEAYKVSFSHAKHTERQSLGCTDCHSVRAGVSQARQVSAPAPLQHHANSARAQSCMGCHNGNRAFGGDDFSSCRRCHQGAHFYF